jgi:membrane protease YdiL (CAAX protease family)
VNSPDEKQRSTRTALVFVILAIGFSWLYLGAVLLARSGVLPFSMDNEDFYVASIPGTIIWAVFRTFGPAIAGFIAVGACLGRASLVELSRSVIRWRVRPSLYIAGWFGLLSSAAFLITGYLLGRMTFSPGNATVLRFLVFFFLMAILDGPFGEEIGWRGVLLPQLLMRLRLLPAAFIVGVVWYVWHIPLYMADGKLPGIGEHAVFLYSCIVLSVIMTWFFVRSGGSTLVAIYVHNCTNYSIFLRIKLFTLSGSPLVPRVAGFAVLTIIALAAARALVRYSGDVGEAGRMSPTQVGRAV